MPKANRKCFNCGASYYACSACIGIRSWKNVCCSVECYRELFKKEVYNPSPIEQDIGEVKDMYVVLKDNNKYEVVGYDIPLGRIDANNGETYTENDIDHLEISVDELKEVAKYNGKW